MLGVFILSFHLTYGTDAPVVLPSPYWYRQRNVQHSSLFVRKERGPVTVPIMALMEWPYLYITQSLTTGLAVNGTR